MFKVTVKSSVTVPVRGAVNVGLLMLKVGVISSIVPVPVGTAMLAFVGLLSVTCMVSGGLLAVSPWMITGIVSVVCPAVKVRVPFVAV